MKIFLKLIPNTSRISIPTSTNQFQTTSNSKSSNREEIILEYEEEFKNYKICEIKSYFSQILGVKLDTLSLFSQDSQNFQIINDEDNLNLYLDSNKKNAHLFYKICSSTIKINIEFYQMNIDKIIIEVSTSCSVYMIKYIINKKLKDKLQISEQELYQISESDLSEESRFNKLLENKLIICDILFLNENNYYSKTEKLKEFKMLLMRKNQGKCSIGLDFSFTLMKNINKLNFDEDAPSFREVSDGLNLFCYCKNKDCKIYNQIFVKNIGYGKFDMMKEISLTICIKCFDYRKVEVRNFGFVNCDWSYKGILNNKKSSFINGDGVTIDHKLYVLNEINFNSCIDKLEFLVKEIAFTNKIKIIEENKKEIVKSVKSDGENSDNGSDFEYFECKESIQNRKRSNTFPNKGDIKIEKKENNVCCFMKNTTLKYEKSEKKCIIY